MSVAINQDEHERINAHEYPGTRQLCCQCNAPTDKCEDDSMYTDDGIGPLCCDCYSLRSQEKERDILKDKLADIKHDASIEHGEDAAL